MRYALGGVIGLVWLVACAIGVGAFAGCASSDAAGRGSAGGAWVLLGERTVNSQLERDVIPVTASEGRFRAVRLAVRGNGIHIVDLKLHFGNGAVQDVAIRRRIGAGGQTRVIDLQGGARVIRKVTMIYRSRGKRPGRAVVRLWGQRAD